MGNMKHWTRRQWLDFFGNNSLILLGSFLLAIGSAIFLTRLNIVAGGLTGIGIIVQHFFPDFQIIDIVVWTFTVILWIVGWFTCGKEFSLRTLLSSITFPGFLTLMLRVEYFQHVSSLIAGDGLVGNVILCGLFAGVFVGSGVALTFLGKGSTGGVDVLIYLLAKNTKLKESSWSFIIDGSIIVISMFVIPDNWINSLVGILSAFITAMMIEFIYNSNISSYQVDVISEKWDEISRFAQDDLKRGATLIPVKGGYHHTDKIMLRVVLEKRQVDTLRKYIADIDPKAFVTFTQTKAVYGEGFKKHRK